jgi:hypothetical protein
MICQKCGRNEAAVHLETFVFRQKVEEHLCRMCAGSRATDTLRSGLSPVQPAPLASSLSNVPKHGGMKILRVKFPIAVREFATALGLKPFKLISELNQLIGFTAMNSTIEVSVAKIIAAKHGFILDT